MKRSLNLETVLILSLGAVLGANLRYWLGGWIAQRWGTTFPFGTLLINLTGSLVLGFFITMVTERFLVDPRWRVFFAHEDTPLSGLVEAFISSGEHRLIVVDRDGRPLSLVSDSDVIERIQPHHRRGVLSALRGRAAPPELSVTARELMSPGAETILAETSVVEAIRRMLANHRKWLVVVDAEGKPLGMVDREIVLEALVR